MWSTKKKRQMGILFTPSNIKSSQVAFRSKMIYKNSDKSEIFHSLQLSLWVYGGFMFRLCLAKCDFTSFMPPELLIIYA